MSHDDMKGDAGAGDAADAVPPSGEVVLSIEPEGLLVQGPEADVAEYVRRLREVDSVDLETTDVDIDRALIGEAASLAAGARAAAGQSARFVRLSPKSMEALEAGLKVPGDSGYWRMMTRGTDGKFLSQLQWKPTSINPQRLMSIQMIAVQVALSSAIGEVEESVRRVEGKVDAVLQRAEAERAGDVIGNNATIERMARYIDAHGSLPDALWESVASLGPVLTATVEQLRNYSTRVIATLESSEGTVGRRAEALRATLKNNKLPESLDLLVVAEESLFKWQRLLVNRVGMTQPDHLETVIADSRAMLASQLEQDALLYHRAVAAVDAAASRDNIDGFRVLVLPKVNQDRATLHRALTNFAKARRHQAESWEELATPTLRQAANAAIQRTKDVALEAADKARVAAGDAVVIGGNRVINLGDHLAGRKRAKSRLEEAETKVPSDANDGISL